MQEKEAMKFKLGYKAGQLFSGAVIHAISKAKADMFSTITKVSAYDYEELHCLLHVHSYIFDAFQNAISHISRLTTSGDELSAEGIVQIFEAELKRQWEYAERDYETFKKYEKKGDENGRTTL